MPSYGTTTGSTEQVGETLSWAAPVLAVNFSGGSWVQGLNSEQHTYGGDWATLKSQASADADTAIYSRRYTATLTRMAGGHCELVTQWQDYVWVPDDSDGSEDTPGSSEDNPVITLSISASQESILTSALFTEGDGAGSTAEQLALYKMIAEGSSLSTIVIYNGVETTLNQLVEEGHALVPALVAKVQQTPSYYVPRIECEVSWTSAEMLTPTASFSIESPQGLEELDLGDRNWLYLGGSSQSVEVQADDDGEPVLMYNNVKKYLLSGVGGWDKSIYGSDSDSE